MKTNLLLASVLWISVAAHAAPEVILDCANLGDGIEARICEDATALTCEESAARVVTSLNSISSYKKVEILAVKKIGASRYRVDFQSVNNFRDLPGINYVNVQPTQNSCAVSTVDLGQRYDLD